MTTVWLPTTDSKTDKVSDHEAVGRLSSSKEQPPHSGFSSRRTLGAVMVTRLTMAAILTALVGVLFQNTTYCELMSCFKNKMNVVLGVERVGSHIQVTMTGADDTSVPCRQFSPYGTVSEENPNCEPINDYAIILHSRKWLDVARWPPESVTSSMRCGVKHYTINFAGIVDPEGHRCSVVPLLSSLKLKKDHCALVRDDLMTAPSSLDDLLEKMSSAYYSSGQSNVFGAKNQKRINEPALNFTDHDGLFISRDCAENFALIVFNAST